MVDRLANVGTEVQKFSIDPVQNRLQKITFARIGAIEQLKKLKAESRVVSVLMSIKRCLLCGLPD